MNRKDKIRYLEGELRSYRYIVNKCWECEQKIEEAQVAKLGISSPKTKGVIYENEGNPFHDKKNELNDIIERNERMLMYWEYRRCWIEKRMCALTEVEYKIIKYRYMMSKETTYQQIAKDIPCHKNTVINKINSALDKMLKIS